MAFQGKISFNPDPPKQVQEVIQSRKTSKTIHSEIFFKDVPVSQVEYKKDFRHLNTYIRLIIAKMNKTIYPIRNFQRLLPNSSLVTICNVYIGPHLDYVVIMFDQPFNNSIYKKM